MNSSSWINFIESMISKNKIKICEWNSHIQLIMKDDKKKREIFLKEIETHKCEV